MFKKSLLVLALTSLSGTALSAGPVANLKITGSIQPPTCTIQGQEEQDFTYSFDVTQDLFPASGDLVMEEKSQNIEVLCDATTFLTFSSTDERAGSELTAGNKNFGLGTYGADDTKVGFYTVTMKNATVKANTDDTTQPVGVITGATYAASGVVDKTQSLGWATSEGNLASGQIFAADFAVTPTISGAMKNTPGDATLDGFAVLSFAFGL